MINVFIDGRAGTTGLGIEARLAGRDDVRLITLPEQLRKDASARAEALNESDVAFLCLPDDAAREAVSLVKSKKTVVIDASTAHRTAAGWAYGFAELSKAHRAAIAGGKRIANPGCYASGFISLVYPLVKGGIAAADYPFTCHAVSGYSGAGKKGIEQYEAQDREPSLSSPRLYALTQQHKHLPEMQKECALAFAPVFDPYICDFKCGMTVTVPLFPRLLNKRVGVQDLQQHFSAWYEGAHFVRLAQEEGFLAANTLAGTNFLEIIITGNEERILLTARLDNLGKGASGAAVQNMNIALGLDERLGL